MDILRFRIHIPAQKGIPLHVIRLVNSCKTQQGRGQIHKTDIPVHIGSRSFGRKERPVLLRDPDNEWNAGAGFIHKTLAACQYPSVVPVIEHNGVIS